MAEFLDRMPLSVLATILPGGPIGGARPSGAAEGAVSVAEFVDWIGPPLLAGLVELALKGAVLLAAAGLVTLALRRSSAAARHLVWLTALVGLLALPVLAAVLPGWHVPLPVRFSERTPTPATSPDPGRLAELAGAGEMTPIALATDRAAASAPGAEKAPSADGPAPTWPLWLWAAGAALAGAPVAGAVVSLRRLRHACRVVTQGPAAGLALELAGRFRLRRRVTLLQSGKRAMPMTWGVWRPVILLPAAADDWPGERLRVVLLHELGHVRRWDCLTQTLACLARALHWFNPLAWLAVARLRAEQERACDDLVLGAGLAPADYAEHLLAVTSGLSSRFLVTPVALAVGRRSKMERRLLSILDARRDRRPLPRRTTVAAVLAGLCLLLPLSVVRLDPWDGTATADERARDEVPADPARRVTDVETKIKEVYGKGVDPKQLTNAALKGLVEALHDPYSEYLSPDQAAELKGQLRGQFTGIGIQIGVVHGKLTVVTPLEDSPALQAGVRPGDQIVAIDGRASAGMGVSDAVRHILGKEGTSVKLKLRSAGGEENERTITRRQLRVRTIEGFRRDAADRWVHLFDPEHQIGYVRVVQFGPTTGPEVRDAVKALQGKGLKGLVLDLRFCPGGLLRSAVDVSNLFLARGTIVVVKELNGAESAYKAEGKGTLGDFPLVVVVNESTASGAEIVSGALKDNHRAVVVGTRTYGKGSVQQLYNLSDGGWLKLTSAHFYLPGGRNIQKLPGQKTWGVDPDDGYYVPLGGKQKEALEQSMRERAVVGRKEAPKEEKVTPTSLRERYGDPQLAAALETMTARLTKGAFVKVGSSDATLQAHLAQRERAQERRAALLKDLQRVNRELADLDKVIGEEKKE